MLNNFTFTCLKHVIYLYRLSRVLELPLRPSKMDSIEVHLTCTCRDVHFRFSAVNDLPKLNKVTNIFLINLSMTLCFVFSLIFMDVQYISLLITVQSVEKSYAIPFNEISFILSFEKYSDKLLRKNSGYNIKSIKFMSLFFNILIAIITIVM